MNDRIEKLSNEVKKSSEEMDIKIDKRDNEMKKSIEEMNKKMDELKNLLTNNQSKKLIV
jgi:predicted translin family RNA/ssDNA-binding protein